jgi:hypothetical protein
MALFTIRIETPLPAPVAWRRILDVHRHGEVVPLTTMTGDALYAAELVPGSRFVARTGVGPLAVDDAMVVDEITEPTDETAGLARIRKEGSVVHGWIELTVTPRDHGGSVVQWVQQISVAGVPGLAGPVTAAVAKAAYGQSLRRLLELDPSD